MVDVPTRDEHNRLDVRITAVEAAMTVVDETLADMSAALVRLEARVAAVEWGTTPPDPLPQVRPVWSETVRQCWGVNAHPGWASGVYGNTDAVVAAVTDLGLAFIRDRVAGGISKAKLDVLQRLAAAGVRTHATLGVLGDSEATVRAACQVVKANPGLFCSVGGPNEPNATGAGWPAKTMVHQAWIWSELAGVVPVYGPSLKDNVPDVGADFRALGATGIGAYCDRADFHRYPRGVEPSNGFYERRNMALAAFDKTVSGCTEGGYNTSDSGVTEAVAAVYAPRQLLEATWAGIDRFGVFELLDQSNDPTVFAGHYGLVATPGVSAPSTWRRKPSFAAVAVLAGFLADPGPDYVPPPVGVAVDGPDDLRSLVVGRRDGSADLIVWRDVPFGASHADVTVTTDGGTETLSVGDEWTSVTLRAAA